MWEDIVKKNPKHVFRCYALSKKFTFWSFLNTVSHIDVRNCRINNWIISIIFTKIFTQMWLAIEKYCRNVCFYISVLSEKLLEETIFNVTRQRNFFEKWHLKHLYVWENNSFLWFSQNYTSIYQKFLPISKLSELVSKNSGFDHQNWIFKSHHYWSFDAFEKSLTHFDLHFSEFLKELFGYVSPFVSEILQKN